ncbi:MAG: InlB B-repeat-containing protein [Candidatus Limivicinus sp.]|jgi:hypothetical protein
MKKRLISILLTVVMVMALFTGITVPASADADVAEVTLSSGQTVLGICQKYGIDYYAHKNVIMALNGFTSEAQFRSIPVGGKIKLPVSNQAAAELSGKLNGKPQVGVTQAPATGAGTAMSLPAGDFVSYYLVDYTIQPGETIAGIYNNMGLSYKTYSNQILKLNNISSYNRIAAGRKLILPTTSSSVPGVNYITVLSHIMRAGESAYNIICGNYNLNFNSVQKMVQALNNRENLANFRVGESLYIPVAGIVNVSNTVTPGTGSTGGGSTSGTVNGATNFNIVAKQAEHGSFSLEADGASIKAAAPGKLVKVVATPEAGYAVESIKVVKVGDAASMIPVSSDGTFMMPNYSVTVSVTFQKAKAYDIKTEKCKNGAVAAIVDDRHVDSAYVGSRVLVKAIPDTGFMLDTIRVTYNDHRDTVAFEDGRFVMPDFPVTISATFKLDPDYDPSKGHAIYTDIRNGKLETLLGNTPVTSAKKGERVTLAITPDKNYTVQSITVYYADFTKTLDVEKNAFTMPDGPVNVVVNVKPTDKAAFDITKVYNLDGEYKVTVDGKEVNSANVGSKVKVTGSSSKEYYNFIPSVTKTDDPSVIVQVDKNGVFEMPDFPVTVRVQFYIYYHIYLDTSNSNLGYFTVNSVLNGMEVYKCGAGVELEVRRHVENPYTHAAGSVLLTYENGTHPLEGTTFIMPNCDVKVRVNFDPLATILAYPVDSPKNAGNGYSILGEYFGDKGNDKVSLYCGVHSRQTVYPSPSLGYNVDEIKISYKDLSGKDRTENILPDPVSGKYQFDMPATHSASPVSLHVSFKEVQTYPITLDYEADGNADHSKGVFHVRSNMGLLDTAAEGTKISIWARAASGYRTDYGRIQVCDKNGKPIDPNVIRLNKNDFSFFMPAEEIRVRVPFDETSHSITVERVPDGPDGLPLSRLVFKVNGTEYDEFHLTQDGRIPEKVDEGSLITVINKSADGFRLSDVNPIEVTRVVDGVKIPVKMITDNRFSFEMPNGDVTIKANYDIDEYAINALPSEHGSYKVPEQAGWIDTVEVTDILPADGYELDKILISYVDHDGLSHENEPISGTSFQLKGMPQSDVDVEVLFKAKERRLIISYIFDGGDEASTDVPDATKLYKVDLSVSSGDGQKQLDITRGDDLGDPTIDLVGILNAGIETGSTVIVNRRVVEGKNDKNYAISRMTLEAGGKPRDIGFGDGPVSFDMPEITVEDYEIILRVYFDKLESDQFKVFAYNTGDGNTEDTFFTDDMGIEVEAPTADTDIWFFVKSAEDSEVVAPDKDTVIAKYHKAGGGDETTKPVLLTEVTSGVYKGYYRCNIGKLDAMPQTPVKVEYKVITKPVTLSVADKSGVGGGGTLDNVNPRWGADVVTVTPTEVTGFTVSGITLDYDIIVDSKTVHVSTPIEKDGEGKYRFIVPEYPDGGKADVVVSYAVAGCPVHYEYLNDSQKYGSVVVVYKDTEIPEGGTIPFGEFYTVKAANGTDCYRNSLKANGVDITPDTSTQLLDKELKIEADFRQFKHSLSVRKIFNDKGEEIVEPLCYFEIGGKEVTEAALNDTISIVAKPGYSITKGVVEFMDDKGNKIQKECSVSDGNASFKLEDVPEKAKDVNFDITVETNTTDTYVMNSIAEGKGTSVCLFNYDADWKNPLTVPFNKDINVLINCEGSKVDESADAAYISYTDQNGKAATKKFTVTKKAEGGYFVTITGGVEAKIGTEVTFHYKCDLIP